MEQILQKVTEALKSDFVGNYVFSDDELSKIYDFTGKLLRSYDGGWGNSISQNYDPLVFVAMVNAVKTWKSDEDTFWECIYKKLMGTAGSQKHRCSYRFYFTMYSCSKEQKVTYRRAVSLFYSKP